MNLLRTLAIVGATAGCLAPLASAGEPVAKAEPPAAILAPATPAAAAAAPAPTAPATATAGPASAVTSVAAPAGTASSSTASLDPAAAAIAGALRAIMDRAPAGGDEVESADRAALATFYRARDAAPLWVTPAGASERGRALAAEIANAAAYGLDPKAFSLPALDGLTGPEKLATTDYQLSLAALTYARHARGGRIPQPAEQLNSNLDRKPQLLDPDNVIERLATAGDITAAVAGLNPPHPQFERLRQAFLAASGDGKGGGKLSTKAKQLRANMEMWRWMWDDLGELHIFNNLPEFVQRVVKDGKVVHTERIVVGQLDKQSSVFSRSLKSVVLRPRWRVPDSIMVHELWPSLLKGGGLMRQHGLEITTKSGEKRDWRTIDWSKEDIRNYHVWQDPGPKSAVGYVKFSFPSQHTIFMHDTPDKWMFNAKRRTLSHGCLRVRNPMDLAEIILAYDKGLSRPAIDKLVKSGPLDNEIDMEKRIPVHLAYFTAWVDDAGKVDTFGDIYGHEKRVTQALDGEWSKINKGRNHLAPPKPRFNPATVANGPPGRAAKKEKSAGSFISEALGINF
ncbi:MAG: L,D-transpeptidase family protein [Hyphomicrobiaceae bacterium]|nr:L,D-transpeptidase family protein [Hyphomicrobiaceae bacterium]